MFQDLRFAFRMINTHRWHSLAVIVTLALGIGINTTVFTLVNAVLFKPVPIPGGERLVTVTNRIENEPRRRSGIAWADYQVFRSENHTFEGLEAMDLDELVLGEPGIPPERVRMARVTPGLFALLRTPPTFGRPFAGADGRAGAEAVVLLGHRLWQNRYHGAPDVIGRAVRVDGRPATIIGIMPEGFRFPENEDLWLPLGPTAALEARTQRRLNLFGLLRPGTTLAEANADLGVLSGRLATEYPDTNKDLRALVRTFHETYNGDDIRTVFLLMLGAVACVLLIACANVANMMLGRALARTREITVRAAMGATRWQIVRQLLVESILLSSLGGLLGLGLSTLGVHAFDLATRDVGKPYWIQFTMDWRAFGYFAVISLLSGILFGLVPALRASRVDLNTALKDGTPGGGGARGGRLSAALVVCQFAFTMVLLAGAGMMIRSFFAVQAINPFVRPESFLSARVQLPDGAGEKYETPQVRARFFNELLPTLAALPGVSGVAAVNRFPGLGSGRNDLEFEGRPAADPKKPPQGSMLVETPDYLATIGLPVLQGRGFTAADGEAGREVAVVSREFAAKHWPGTDPIGRRFRSLGDDKPGAWLTVVGVCANLVQETREPDPAPVFHVPHQQEPWSWMGLLVRTTGDPATLAGPVRAAVQAVDQDLSLYEVGTLTSALARSHWFLVVFGTLFLSFALTGLLMASVGIYAVVAQGTARRTREIGIRMALGATAAGIARLVLARGLLQLGLGLAVGLAGALGASHLMAKTQLVPQVSAGDPLVFTGITLLLIAIGLAACWLPARRAARIAPTEALRNE